MLLTQAHFLLVIFLVKNEWEIDLRCFFRIVFPFSWKRVQNCRQALITHPPLSSSLLHHPYLNFVMQKVVIFLKRRVLPQ